jgi:hypothetical protein
VGFTAAETGLKRHIVRILPVTKNLVMAMPSPPIKELIDYVVVLHNTAQQTGRGGLIPRSIRKLLIKMGELRNQVTHTGEHDPDGEKLTFDFLDEKLKAVRDLLWLLDFYAGYRWAWEYVSEERRAELSEPLVKRRES